MLKNATFGILTSSQRSETLFFGSLTSVQCSKTLFWKFGIRSVFRNTILCAATLNGSSLFPRVVFYRGCRIAVPISSPYYGCQCSYSTNYAGCNAVTHLKTKLRWLTHDIIIALNNKYASGIPTFFASKPPINITYLVIRRYSTSRVYFALVTELKTVLAIVTQSWGAYLPKSRNCLILMMGMGAWLNQVTFCYRKCLMTDPP